MNDVKPWQGMRAILLAPVETTHLVVIQDDALVCDRFEEALHAVVSAQPDRLICLFHAGRPKLTAKRVQRAPAGTFVELIYQRLTDWTPTVATVWPAPLLGSFRLWDSGPRKALVSDRQRGDDQPIGKFCRAHGGAVACVPSIVQHPDDVPSTWKTRPGTHGRDRNFIAARYDPTGWPWTAG